MGIMGKEAPGKFSSTQEGYLPNRIETQKPLGQEVSVDICQYLLYHLRMYFLYPASVSAYYCVPRVH